MTDSTSVCLSLGFVVLLLALTLQLMWHKSEFQAERIKKLEESLLLMQDLIIARVREKHQRTPVCTIYVEMKTVKAKPKSVVEVQLDDPLSKDVKTIGINIHSSNERQFLKTIENLELQTRSLSVKIEKLTRTVSELTKENFDLRNQLEAHQNQSVVCLLNETVEKKTSDGNGATEIKSQTKALPPTLKPEIVSSRPVVRNKYVDQLNEMVEQGRLRLASTVFSNMDFLKEAAKKQEQMRLDGKSLEREESFSAELKTGKRYYGKRRENN